MLPHMSGEFRVVKDARTGVNDDGTNWAQVRVMASRSARREDGTWETVDRLFLTIKPRRHQVDDVAALRQGDDVFLSGEPHTAEFTGRDGNPRSDLVMYPRQVRLLLPRNGGAPTRGPGAPGGPSTAHQGPGNGWNQQEGPEVTFGGSDEAPF